MGTKRFKTPGAERQSALEAATQLMAEQVKYEQWLEDLEAKKDSTPPKVFDRVRQDYLARLQTVMEQLTQYTTTLQEHAETLEAKLRDLEEAEEANGEEQAEAALRKQVGEMTSAEFESGSRKAQRELAKIKENQTVILADLNRIRELFGEEEEEEEEEEVKKKPEAPKARKGSTGFNELDFLTSVVGPVPAPAPAVEKRAATPPAAQAVAPAAPAAAPRVSNPPAPAPAAATRVSNPTPPPAAPVATPSAPVAAPPPTRPTPPRPVATPSAPVAATPPAPAKADAEPENEPKTLKCQECGALNSPNEWYCERCGAELTVV